MQIKKIYSLKNITVACNNSLRILINLPSRCSASFMFATNYIKSFNERIRSYIFSLLCRIQQSDNLIFLLIIYILIFIIRAVCIITGGRYYTHDISIVFLIKLLTTYLINFLISKLFLTLHLYLYVDDIIALIVLYVLYFSYIFLIVSYVYIYIYIYIYIYMLCFHYFLWV